MAGSEHLSRGLGCDDAFGYAIAGDLLIAAVADGAGSVSGTSAWGAYIACRSVVAQGSGERLRAELRRAVAEDADAVMRRIFTSALDAVQSQAAQMRLPVTALSTTLCVALTTPSLALFGQIGDGVIASRSGEAGVIGTHLIEQKADYANATCFIQTAGAFEHSFRTHAQPAPTALALSTDGMTYKITDVSTGEPYRPFFEGSWRHIHAGATDADLTALLTEIEDDQTGDDKTLVLAALRWADDEPGLGPRRGRTVTSAPPPPPSG